MTTIAELIDTAPAPTDGQPILWSEAGGGWRGVFQIADPLAGSAVEWFDLSEYLLGYNLTKGASTYGGRPEATVANIEVMADDGILAPTNADTSALFGDHIDLGPGLLARFSLIRVAAGVVVEWLPRFTLKVEYWGNASHARGQIRRHLIVARDTFTSLVDVPVAAADPQDWSDKVVHITTGAAWQYGILAYHDFSLLLPERDEQASSVRELDAALDPAGLVWFTDRYGHLYIRPRPGDTLHAGSGYSLPTVQFHYLATPSTSGLIAYAIDYDAAEPFGLAKSETGVKNRVQITSPGGTFDQDDATSVQRFDPKVYRASWIADNDQAAADLLAYRAFAQMEATPLYTCLGQPGFHDLLLADYLYPAAIDHTASVFEEVTSASGVVRRLEESARFEGSTVDMSIATTLDIETYSTVDGLILPVEDLELDAVGDTGSVFTWTNPTQVVIPTHTQIRMIGVTSIWVTAAYPITGFSWGGLDPNTGYQFQVRLVQIVDGIVTAASAIRVVNFTTTFTIPIVDPGGGTVTFPPPECGTLDWELQESDDGTTWTIIDDGTISSPPFTLDLSLFVFDPTKAYRFRMDACGDTWYSSPFFGECTDPPALGGAPFDDADLVAYWPGICPPDRIVEVVTEEEADTGPCFDLFVLDGDMNVVLVADGEGVVAYGQVPAVVDGLTGDATIAAKVQLASQPDDPTILFAIAGLWIYAIVDGANWAVQGVVQSPSGAFTTITPGTLALDFGAWYDVALVHDVVAEDLFLYVDGVEVASALGTTGARTDFTGTGAVNQFIIGQTDNGLITNCAVWDRVLAPEELPGWTPPPTPIMSGGTETTTGGYKYHTFTSSGTLTVTGGGMVDYLVVGGGGGGGGWHRGGGGGGGEVVAGSINITSNKSITVGAGGTKAGAGASPGPAGTAGGASSIAGVASAAGGGRGGGGDNAYAPTSGGSGGGGGGAATGSPHAGASAGSGVANAGGQGASANTAGGGGGGAGGAGVAASSTSNGGAGYTWSDGVSYAGGGGGGRFTSFGAGAAGGGNGGTSDTGGVNGTANRGGGGGGGGNFSTNATQGGDGGSGVVIVRYPYP